MKEEDKILRKVGTENHFSVPEGYFENLTSEVMKKLPKKENPTFAVKEPTTWDKVKPWVYMAAMFVGAALIIRVASSDDATLKNKAKRSAETELNEPVSDEYIDVVLSHSMLDDYSLYVYLSDAE
ncbi:hypothetical protein [uncultured Bacteroides sp.]|uniref:hypothetical protein n=1 Tax=uncultured Bacteroides sp. TaxID=162156 RepID=UPI002AABBE54|nr:hypothetical protein [uncultured Bacteroides sp.]